MPLSYRIVCSCLFALFFFIMLAVKLDRKTDWNWFLVFLPLWLFDVIFLVLLIFRLFTHLRNGLERDTSLRSVIANMGVSIFGLVMKISFEIMLCVKLQYAEENLAIFYVFIPLWIVLLIAVIKLFPWAPEIISLIKRNHRASDTSSTNRSSQSSKRTPTTSGLSNTVGAHPRSVGSRSTSNSS